jgi:hypothetical protein
MNRSAVSTLHGPTVRMHQELDLLVEECRGDEDVTKVVPHQAAIAALPAVSTTSEAIPQTRRQPVVPSSVPIRVPLALQTSVMTSPTPQSPSVPITQPPVSPRRMASRSKLHVLLEPLAMALSLSLATAAAILWFTR